MPSLEELAFKHALANATEHGGKANAGSVVGRVVAEAPELKKDMAAVGKAAAAAVAKVNKLSPDEQKKELEKMGGVKKPEKEERVGLPELPGAVKGKVVMRFAPNPNGPIHIGHTRQALLNDEYTKRYKGKFVLRFDNTDPKTEAKRPMKEAYDWIRRDLKWLGVKVAKEAIASQRLKIYYEHFEELLRMGKAYICTDNVLDWREKKRMGEACRHRELPPEVQLEEWRKMLSGEYQEGDAVARVKTDLSHPDPAARDWAAFRIIGRPEHPIVGNKWKVWPMLDFASAIDDHELGTTHIIRGVDLQISEVRQRFLYDYMGWTYPATLTTGKLFIEGGIVSKSKIFAGIKSGEFTGWDDPRLATISALRRRGFQPEAIRAFIVEIGPNPSNIVIDMANLEAHNRKVIDKISNRYFFVAEPIEITLDKIPIKVAKAPIYPGKRTYRSIPVSKKVFVDKIDFVANKGKEVRLMHMANFVLDKKAVYTGLPVKETPKMHWVGQKHIPVKVVRQDGKIIEGIGEPELKKVKVDQMVQFERISFARCDSTKPLVFYLAHR